MELFDGDGQRRQRARTDICLAREKPRSSPLVLVSLSHSRTPLARGRRAPRDARARSRRCFSCSDSREVSHGRTPPTPRGPARPPWGTKNAPHRRRRSPFLCSPPRALARTSSCTTRKGDCCWSRGPRDDSGEGEGVEASREPSWSSPALDASRRDTGWWSPIHRGGGGGGKDARHLLGEGRGEKTRSLRGANSSD